MKPTLQELFKVNVEMFYGLQEGGLKDRAVILERCPGCGGGHFFIQPLPDSIERPMLLAIVASRMEAERVVTRLETSLTRDAYQRLCHAVANAEWLPEEPPEEVQRLRSKRRGDAQFMGKATFQVKITKEGGIERSDNGPELVALVINPENGDTLAQDAEGSVYIGKARFADAPDDVPLDIPDDPTKWN